MKYRIKKVTHKDGEVIYYAQYYKGFFSGWAGIFRDGQLCIALEEADKLKTREEALKVIDLADVGKGVIVEIEFENVIK